MFKKIFSFILAASMFANITAFASLQNNDGAYTEDFEGYISADDIISDDSVIKDYTGMAPELGTIGGNSVMVVNSVSGTNSIVYTNPSLFEGDVNVFKFKIGADQSPKLNWNSSSGLVISYTDASGKTANGCIFDFAWSLVRHKENGVTEKGICGFTPASQKLYNTEIRTSKVKKDGEYFYDVTYIVEGNEYSLSFPTVHNGTMCLGFKSTTANKLYVDDMESYSMVSVLPSVNVEGRMDVCVIPSVEIEFSDAIDESTLTADNILAGDVAAESVESLGDNRYLVTFENPLEKNTTYILDLSGVRDVNGNPAGKTAFEFKTVNTAVVVRDGEAFNTSKSDEENIVIYTPEYDENGAFVNKTANSLTLAPGESVDLGDEDFFIVTEDFKPVDASVFVSDAGEFSEEFDAYYDSESGIVTVCGKTDASFKDEKVLIMIENSAGGLEYAGMIKTMADGYFSANCPFSADSGIYTITAVSSSEEFQTTLKILRDEDVKTLKENFEKYSDGSEIIGNSKIIKETTKSTPELENFTSKAMAVVSGTVYTGSDLFDGDLNIFKCKIGADSAPKLNWGSSSSLVFSHSNDNGIMVDDYIFDFAWSLIRHRENGEAEKGICGFSSGKLYNVEIKSVKAFRDGKYYYDVTYIVDGAENHISYPTTKDGKMRFGFMSTSANKVYVDDIEVSSFELIMPEVNIANRSDVEVRPSIEIVLPGTVDTETLSTSNIYVGNIYADTLEYAGDDKYIITLTGALEKNKEYVLDISSVLDFYGNPLKEDKFAFKTKNTAIVIEDGEIVNTSANEAENIVIAVPSYDSNGTMTAKTFVSYELAPMEKYDPETGKFFVYTPDFKPVVSNVYVPYSGIESNEFKAEFNTDTQKMTVFGKTAAAYANEIIFIGVMDEAGEIDYACTTKTAQDGYFSISYTPVTKSGKYTVIAKSMTQEFTGDAVVRLKKDADALLDAVNTGNAEEITGALELYDEVMAVEIDLYDNHDNRNFIASGLKKSAPYTSVEELAEAVEILAVAYNIKSSANKAEAFENYSYVIFGDEEDIGKMWSDLSYGDKNSVLDTVTGNGNFIPEEFKNEILAETILTMISRAGKYIDVKNAIENHSAILGINLKDYEKAGKPSSVAKNLCGKKWTPDSFVNKFDDLVDDSLNDDSGKKGSSGGGGGGGASPVPGNVALPQTEPSPMEVGGFNGNGSDKQGFTDIDSSFWAKEAIDSLCERKILNGYEDGSFRPDEIISREEFVTVIIRYLGLELNYKCGFSDVSENDWFLPFVSAAYENGIINGISESEFGAGMPVTRQDAAVILYNIKKFENSGDTGMFSDSDMIAQYAKTAVAALSGSGIINGNPDGSFNPEGYLTRAQAAKMVFFYDKEVGR